MEKNKIKEDETAKRMNYIADF